MVKLTISYENEGEKAKALETLKKGFRVSEIKKEYQSGKYKKVYVKLIDI